MTVWVVIADDLTGACDTAAAFARQGWLTRVALTPQADLTGADAWALTTESRALEENEAARAVEQALQRLPMSKTQPVYKKIDSTLRGHPGVELGALLRALGEDRALVTPAFPEQGRAVLDGHVFVSGVPLAQTSFASEVPQANLLRLFDVGAGSRAIQLEDARQDADKLSYLLSEPGVYVADAETAEDLSSLAQAARKAGIRVLCGSAGLAREVVRSIPPGVRYVSLPHQSKPVLLAAGSRHPATLAQVTVLEQSGVPVVCPSQQDFITEQRYYELVLRIANVIRQERAAVFSVAEIGEMPNQGDLTGTQQVAAWIASVVGDTMEQVAVGSLILTGGETAAAICREIGCDAIDLGGEVQPGIVWGRLSSGRFAGLPVVTKAGGFGSPTALLEAVRFLAGW